MLKNNSLAFSLSDRVERKDRSNEREVRLEMVRHRFEGGEYLFEPLTITLLPGVTYALMGPSGSGKSTLLNIIAGWCSPFEGNVIRKGILDIGWVFQNPFGIARRSAIDHVALPLLALGLNRRDAEKESLEALRVFGLQSVAEHQFSSLSGGEAQRLMLARALVASPDLLLVDEPTAQLDSKTASTVNEVLSNVSASGSIVVVATHNEQTSKSCDKKIVLA